MKCSRDYRAIYAKHDSAVSNGMVCEACKVNMEKLLSKGFSYFDMSCYGHLVGSGEFTIRETKRGDIA